MLSVSRERRARLSGIGRSVSPEKLDGERESGGRWWRLKRPPAMSDRGILAETRSGTEERARWVACLETVARMREAGDGEPKP